MSKETDDKILSIFWPLKTVESPNIIQRAGRVFHWAILGSGVGLTVLFNETESWQTLSVIILGFILVGRAVRYILSGE